ncbi:glycosyltransferase family 15 protein [Lentithecium fluviatile CBS 122367]|uniref:Glycosyltransferase family 15 protein n=1 Tax=Lentithecium fluviatile CBS 122367 TaxID=1168545 RepID=A0A6G1J1F9_9PLEO|nr:glycosyltransferase family 15 protein [Lentithecium fluviatile CBS 122367]
MRYSRPARFVLFALIWIVFIVLLLQNRLTFFSTKQRLNFLDVYRPTEPSPLATFAKSPQSSHKKPTQSASPIHSTLSHEQGPIKIANPERAQHVKPEEQLERVNATFVTLARNSDIGDLAGTIKQIEDRFNSRYKYDWVFLNDKEFDSNFKRIATRLVSGRARFGKIPSSQWSFPSHVDVEKAANVRAEMKEQKIIYGDSISYRHMCRYQSGFFFQHPLMMEYEYYWRVEPSAEFYCDIPFDPFRIMVEEKKKYGFVISLLEYETTVPTLWNTTKTFFKQHPEHLAKDNSMDFISDDGGYSYNLCHFWSNFEIASLEWLRSPAYTAYFEALDQAGGFFYERWGDAPIHSLAAALMLRRDEIHFFNEIGYYHAPFTHCPTGKMKDELRCYCESKENFDWKGYSCTSKWFDFMGREKPDGYEDE